MIKEITGKADICDLDDYGIQTKEKHYYIGNNEIVVCRPCWVILRKNMKWD